MKLIMFDGSGHDASAIAGVLHFWHPVMGGEYTLCGITLDGDEKTAGGFRVVEAEAVTCKRCAAIIVGCRGVKVSPKGS